jgi:hypothetical protein
MQHPLRPTPSPPISHRLAEFRDLMGKIHPIGRITTPRSALILIKRSGR